MECAMIPMDADDTTTYVVLINAEEQYSLWQQHKPVPAGWTIVGKAGLESRVYAVCR